MATIEELLGGADLPDSPTARLDAELLLAKALGQTRGYLYAWPKHAPDAPLVAAFQDLLARRRQGEPVAYLLGRQGFWSLELQVTPAVLIPRPETELLVETALGVTGVGAGPGPVLDLGTGSGAIALALAAERPAWRLLGVDRSPAALAVAEANRQRLRLDNLSFQPSDWFSALSGQRFALIVANPPYIPEADQHLAQGDLRFEPITALASGSDGLDDLRHIIGQAPGYLESGGCLALEHGYDQADEVLRLLRGAGFEGVENRRDLAGHPRVSLGVWYA